MYHQWTWTEQGAILPDVSNFAAGPSTIISIHCHAWARLTPHVPLPHQVGDQLDRGDNEIEILYFLERLQQEAEAAGGALHVLTGNHETMNAQGRFRYATQDGTAHFQRWHMVDALAAALKVGQPCHACSSCICPGSYPRHPVARLRSSWLGHICSRIPAV